MVTAYLQEEGTLEKVLGPLWFRIRPWLQVSSFGVIPKDHTPGKWRLIIDLFSPEENSANDVIFLDLCSLSYFSIDEVNRVMASLAEGQCLPR